MSVFQWLSENAVDKKRDQAISMMLEAFSISEREARKTYSQWRRSFVGCSGTKTDGTGERKLAFAVALRIVDDFQFPEYMFNAMLDIESGLTQIFQHIGIDDALLRKHGYEVWNNGGRERALEYFTKELPRQRKRQVQLSAETKRLLRSRTALQELLESRRKAGKREESIEEARARLSMNASNQLNAASSTAYMIQKYETKFRQIERNAARYR